MKIIIIQLMIISLMQLRSQFKVRCSADIELLLLFNSNYNYFTYSQVYITTDYTPNSRTPNDKYLLRRLNSNLLNHY